MKFSQNGISFDFRDVENLVTVKKVIRNVDPDLSVAVEGTIMTAFYDEYALNKLQDKVIDQSIEIVRMRVDSTGTKEPIIQRQGVRDILLQVPGEENPAELKRVLGKTAKMTFHIVDDGANVEIGKIWACSE
jgi:preprotein translocase subunit SecD